MMDKTIHKHLDKRMDIQESASKMLEEVLDSIDLKAVVKNPRRELARVGHVAMGIAEAHAKDAADEGTRFAKECRAAEPVVFEETEDPKANEEDAPGD